VVVGPPAEVVRAGGPDEAGGLDASTDGCGCAVEHPPTRAVMTRTADSADAWRASLFILGSFRLNIANRQNGAG